MREFGRAKNMLGKALRLEMFDLGKDFLKFADFCHVSLICYDIVKFNSKIKK